MLYYVKLNDTILFKGNFYKCIEYIEKIQVGGDNLKISHRK